MHVFFVPVIFPQQLKDIRLRLEKVDVIDIEQVVRRNFRSIVCPRMKDSFWIEMC
jgi:hypothetical protein